MLANTTFNGINLFSTATNTITIQAGAESVDSIDVTLPELDAAATMTARFWTSARMAAPGFRFFRQLPAACPTAVIWWNATPMAHKPLSR